jgi:DNA-binding protein HU-beta
MTKADVVEGLSTKLGVPKIEAEQAIDSLNEHITNSLKEGDRLNISGIGTFSVSQREARTGRNPITGEPIEISASRAAKFNPGKELKDSLNNGGSEGNHASTRAE